MLAEGDTPEEFLEHTKLELFQDQVFCFTPKGRLIALPRGATPIDFAYAVHTDIGDTTIGARVNGRGMPLMTELHNGDEVEIITSKGQVPPSAWESMVVTGKARSAIRRATRAAVRRQYAGLGRQIVERAFERANRSYTDKLVEAVLPRLAQNNVEDMLAAVGRGEIPSANVLRAVYPDHKEERQGQDRDRRGVVRPQTRLRHEVSRARPDQADLRRRSLRSRCRRHRQPKSDPWPSRRNARPLCRGRGHSGRAHRRHHDARRGDHDLPNSVGGAEGV
jgi:(p)ppGpp synthase/HD superfamily hydrolase